jgi:hypothetical protein
MPFCTGNFTIISDLLGRIKLLESLVSCILLLQAIFSFHSLLSFRNVMVLLS